MILRARILLSITHPPVENGAVRIDGHRVVEAGPWGRWSLSSHEPVFDLGEVILLPGLINAHCHLDYTGMAGLIPKPRSFPDWIKELLALKAQWSYADYAASWLNGAKMLLRNGTTTVADIEAVPELLPDVWSSTPLRVYSFLEMTGVKNRRSPRETLAEAVKKIESLPRESGLAGLSPHAPYSTNPELLQLSAQAARERHWRLAIHAAESRAEFDMYQSRTGPLFDWLQSQRAMEDCGGVTPVQALERQGLLGRNLLAIHANYLSTEDVRLLSERGAHVVHCPRSHAYFGHDPFPLDRLRAAGVNICLGTDSLVSVRPSRSLPMELDLFSEMHCFCLDHPGIDPEEVVRMATTNAARALGLAGQRGELRAGGLADCIAIPYQGAVDKVWEAVVQHRGGVSNSLINGNWQQSPPA